MNYALEESPIDCFPLIGGALSLEDRVSARILSNTLAGSPTTDSTDREMAFRLRAAVTAALDAAEIALQWRRSAGVSPIEAVETRMEETIRNILHRAFPGESILGEELGLEGDGIGGLWVLDPIDGTEDFVKGRRTWAVSIGYMVNHRPAIGVVHAPDLGTVYQSSLSTGLVINGRKPPAVRQSNKVAFGWAGRQTRSGRLATRRRLRSFNLSCIFDLPAAIGLALVASGQLAAYADDPVWLWDVAGGIALAAHARVHGVTVDYPPLVDRQGQVVAGSAPTQRRVESELNALGTASK